MLVCDYGGLMRRSGAIARLSVGEKSAGTMEWPVHAVTLLKGFQSWVVVVLERGLVVRWYTYE